MDIIGLRNLITEGVMPIKKPYVFFKVKDL